MVEQPAVPFGHVIGRYSVHGEIASGGMASVHYGRLLGPAGFSRAVAIKRLHPQFAKDPEFVSMFLDEARLAARIRHPNVVSVLDVVARAGELFLVMEYVHGESLSRILRTCNRLRIKPPLEMVSAVLGDVLRGLHAAHEACDDRGESLNIVHRDMSPQNILVGADGLARLLDFGIAKAVGRAQTTRDGQLKGKLGYMAPEQLGFDYPITRRTDIYAAGVVLWETLTTERYLPVDGPVAAFAREFVESRPRLSEKDPRIPNALDEVILKATQRNPEDRFETACEMADALEKAVRPGTVVEVGRWVTEVAGDELARREEQIAEIEQTRASVNPEELDGALEAQGPIVRGDPEARTVPDWSPVGLAEKADTLEVQSIASDATPKGISSLWRVSALALVTALVAGGLIVRSLTGARREALTLQSRMAAEIRANGSGLVAVPHQSNPAMGSSATPVATADPTAPPVASGSRRPIPNPRPTTGSPADSPADSATKPSGTSPSAATGSKKTPRLPPAASARPAWCAWSAYVVDSEGIRRVKPECLKD